MTVACTLSVIVPIYNAQPTLAAAVNSFLAQETANAEIVLVNDGSADGSQEIIERYRGKATIVEQDNRGAAAARNAGLQASRGKYVKFLDADDYLLPFSLEAQIQHVTGLPERSISYGRMLSWFDESGLIRPHGARDHRPDNDDTIDRLLADVPVTAALIYPREVLEDLGGFDERLALMDDFDLFARSILSGCEVHACRQPVYVYRQHRLAGRISRRCSIDDYRSLAAMFERLRVAFDAGACRHDRRQVSRGLSRIAWIKARTALRLGHVAEARRMFSTARRLDAGCAAGHPLYRALTRLLGPITAETVTAKARSLAAALGRP